MNKLSSGRTCSRQIRRSESEPGSVPDRAGKGPSASTPQPRLNDYHLPFHLSHPLRDFSTWPESDLVTTLQGTQCEL